MRSRPDPLDLEYSTALPFSVSPPRGPGRLWRGLGALTAIALLSACASSSGGGGFLSNTSASVVRSTLPDLTPEQVRERQQDILAMRERTLKELFASHPEAEEVLRKAAGYAVFDTVQYNVLLLVGAQGSGVLVDNATQQPTYMLVTRAGTGPGVGYKDFRQVLIFKSRGLLEQFRSVGADLGASADATFKPAGETGASLAHATSFDPMLSVYQFTDQGVLLQANWGGAAYLPDPRLNGKTPAQ